MSFNNAWNHVRLSLDQQGMSLRAVSLAYFLVTQLQECGFVI